MPSDQCRHIDFQNDPFYMETWLSLVVRKPELRPAILVIEQPDLCRILSETPNII